MDAGWLRDCMCYGNGRLFLMKRKGSDDLLLVCEECESAWKSPEEAALEERNISIEGAKLEYASRTEIAARWPSAPIHEGQP